MEEKKVGVVIPQEKLSKEALKALIEEFILREGTDYGSHEYSLEEKRQKVFKQLKTNQVLIFFDPELENTNLLTVDQIKKLNRQNFEIVGLPEGL